MNSRRLLLLLLLLLLGVVAMLARSDPAAADHHTSNTNTNNDNEEQNNDEEDDDEDDGTVRDLPQWERDHMKEDHHLEDYSARSFFKMHDTEGDGYLDEDELRAVFVSRGDMAVDKLVVSMMANFDADKDGALSYAEYAKATTGEDVADTDTDRRKPFSRKPRRLSKMTKGPKGTIHDKFQNKPRPARNRHGREPTPPGKRVPTKFRTDDNNQPGGGEAGAGTTANAGEK